MKARAPGKLVLSGAYAVLERAPAIVTAVDRYVVADTEREPEFITPEVECALGRDRAPWFDAEQLRSDGRKLGLGSSAAIVVASIAARTLLDYPSLDSVSLADRVFPLALRAHREAQGGGSGIDVLASAYGASRVCCLDCEGQLGSRTIELPKDIVVHVYASGHPASTRDMLALVRRFAKSNASDYADHIARLSEAARNAVSARTPDAFVHSIVAQVHLLASLGDRSGAPIVPLELRQLADAASPDGVAILPSGAGGGDIVVCLGPREPCLAWQPRIQSIGLSPVDLRIAAPGVHRCD